MKKAFLLKILIGIISLGLSLILCNLYVSKFWAYIGVNKFTSYITFLTITIYIYIVIFIFIERKIRPIYFDIAIASYTLIIILFSLLRTYNVYCVNLNPLQLIEDFKNYHSGTMIILILNIFVYLPMGVYLKYKFNLKFIPSIALFLGYIFFIEMLQFLIKKGVFDIVDIITNTFGFALGIIIFGKSIVYRSSKNGINK